MHEVGREGTNGEGTTNTNVRGSRVTTREQNNERRGNEKRKRSVRMLKRSTERSWKRPGEMTSGVGALTNEHSKRIQRTSERRTATHVEAQPGKARIRKHDRRKQRSSERM
ncbi:hypothetical protein R1flu_028289 [Riccia fluitans]|uniref:Uncharacterized protein n=1 Tax=Riccia fluitans TaxID=41844 RepID=A0ABD1XP85_9MARC